TANVRFVIATKCRGPTSPFGSGGVTRPPKILKLSSLLGPSNVSSGDGITPVGDCVWGAPSHTKGGCTGAAAAPSSAGSGRPLGFTGFMWRSGGVVSNAAAVPTRSGERADAVACAPPDELVASAATKRHEATSVAATNILRILSSSPLLLRVLTSY